MKREITIDDLPAPGEPLREKIADVNQMILDDEIRERAARIQSRLKPKQLKQLRKRFDRLASQLKRAGYNALILERYELYQRCVRLSHQLESVTLQKAKAIQRELKETAAAGKAINQKIAPLKPVVAEFEIVAGQIKAHEAVLAWEKEERENFEAFRREAATWQEQIKSVMRQSGRLHNKWTDTKGKIIIDIPVIERIIIKDDKVMFQIKTSGQGLLERLFGRWHSALPYDVDINDLTCEDTLNNLSAGCKRVVTVERSQNGVNLFWVISRLDSPDGIPKSFLFSRCIDLYPFEDHRKTPWAAGVTTNRKIEWYNFEDYPNVLIAGAPGGGKSNHLNGMIATVCSMNRPDEVRVVLIDLKGGIEFGHLRGIKHLMGNIVKTPSGVLTAMQSVREVMENRLEIFEAAGAKKLSAYNAKSAEPMPRIIVFVDEMATLVGLGEMTTDIHNELRVISSQGRAAGIHLVLATQHPSVDVLPGWVKTNMNMRIASKMPSHTASQVILDTISAALLPSIAGRMVFSRGRDEIIAQSPFISDEEIAKAVRASQLYEDAVEIQTQPVQPVVVKEKFSQRDVIEMALTKFNGKLSPSRIHEEVGNEVISERKLKHLIQDITEPGVGSVIEHDGCLYKLGKDRKTWLLKPVVQLEQPGNILDDEDTAETSPVEHPAEEQPIELEAIA